MKMPPSSVILTQGGLSKYKLFVRAPLALAGPGGGICRRLNYRGVSLSINASALGRSIAQARIALQSVKLNGDGNEDLTHRAGYRQKITSGHHWGVQ